ncbi:hypothetical protein M91_04019 [Bos mutus]|uniref:Uncharacterized protein n=1 Tax=Bos mutus TaxID=72004 RepID=L8IC93_9CETA|nr:hypothetical protein M91_04019 [Bos mutus]
MSLKPWHPESRKRVGTSQVSPQQAPQVQRPFSLSFHFHLWPERQRAHRFLHRCSCLLHPEVTMEMDKAHWRASIPTRRSF